MANYVVKKGDTLSHIALRYNTTVSKLVQLNNIKNPDYIVVGQVLRLSDSDPSTTNNTVSQTKPIINLFGIQSNTDRTLFTTWNWNRSHTKEYKVIWYYDTGNGVWFVGNDSTTEYNQSIYTPPENAVKVKFRVKAISDTYTNNNKEVSYWTSQWSTDKVHTMSVVMDVPPVPTVKMDNLKLMITMDNLDVNGDKIEFYICKDNTIKYKQVTVTINQGYVSYTCNVDAGSVYKVKCRSVKNKLYSDWSNFSTNLSTAPNASKGIKTISATSETEVHLLWEPEVTAVTYEVEYTTEIRYFNKSNQTSTMTIDAKISHSAEVTGLEPGTTYFFRVRSCNEQGKSGWTDIKEITVGKKPTAPTTWSSTTTAVVSDIVNLYWVHNAQDGSSQTYAQLELDVNGKKTTQTIKNTTVEEEKDLTSSYALDTSSYEDGTVVKWRVKTRGIIDEYSDWSTQRTIQVYAPAVLTLNVTGHDGSVIEPLTSLPFNVSATPGPVTQKPIGYHLSVVSNDNYETIDQVGNTKIVSEGDTVYSRYINYDSELTLSISAGDIDLENNCSYTLICIVSMDSGLTAEAQYEFTVSWSDELLEPNAEVIYDPDTYTININPYCMDQNGVYVEDITLSVYRIEYDGKFTEIATGIEDHLTYVTDPHPSLNYARYRIVAISKATGAVGYFDMPGYYVGEKAILIQWAEAWKNFNVSGEDLLEDKPWSGSLLRLPYNIDITDNNSPDVAFVNYIGREHPVSYYGTQVGETSTWNTVIRADDEETIYALRRLAKWMGDVYVREPSGTGYWANVNVSFSQKHREVSIPVSLKVTRVEGGI